jgi:hypothetical protein
VQAARPGFATERISRRRRWDSGRACSLFARGALARGPVPPPLFHPPIARLRFRTVNVPYLRLPVCALRVVLVLDRLLNRLPARPIAGIVDEAAHVATGALVLAAWPAPDETFAAGLAAGSVPIDIDHVPEFGWAPAAATRRAPAPPLGRDAGAGHGRLRSPRARCRSAVPQSGSAPT